MRKLLYRLRALFISVVSVVAIFGMSSQHVAVAVDPPPIPIVFSDNTATVAVQEQAEERGEDVSDAGFSPFYTADFGSLLKDNVIDLGPVKIPWIVGIGIMAVLAAIVAAIVGFVRGGASGSSTPIKYDAFSDGPNGTKKVEGTGGLKFPNRSIQLSDPQAKVTASVTFEKEDQEAFAALAQWAAGSVTAMPVDYTASPEVAAQGITITHTFSRAIPEGAVYGFLYWDEQDNMWIPIDSTLSSDRKTIVAKIDHLTRIVPWLRFPPGSEKVLQAISTPIEILGEGTQAVWRDPIGATKEFMSHLGTGAEIVSHGFQLTSGMQAAAPECDGKIPAWVSAQPSYFEVNRHAPVKYCAGGSDGLLQIKVVNSRSFPIHVHSNVKPVDFDTGLSTWTVAKKLFLEFPVEPLNIFTTDSGGLTAPGGTQTLYFSEEDVRSAGSLSISTTHPSFGEQVAFVAMNELIKEYLDLDPKLVALIVGARCGVDLGEKYSLEQIGYSSTKCAGEIASVMADSMKENAISRLQSEAAEKALKSKVFFLNALRIATGFGAQLTADALAGLTTTRLTIPIKYKDDPEPSHVTFTQDGFMSIRLGDPEQKVKGILTFERFDPGAGANACSLYKSSAHPYTCCSEERQGCYFCSVELLTIHQH
ncbi:hypothetical protein P4N68_06025 [Corynebacterium felinum]|uniref:Uncharacterized protein n=1 Tax=Corynebacterium felinum TaxID=131318 RepID=A0ABU2B563_9CORY|nr:hypothetical protein [Corynebacterium felinum]MDF5820636.1 hypothetical protein [Corynebacterium felinum]MDR7353541.1 hypothetical protein [Corynebacterium felinum]